MMKIASAFTGTSRLNIGRSFPMLIVVVLLSSLLGATGCSDESAEVTFPSVPPQESRQWLFDVYGTAANDVYVGGNLGVMYHFDGSTWELQPMGSTAAITTIWSPLTETTMYAVGHGGRIWRNTGSGWGGMESGTTQDLFGIGSFGDNLHAVGANGTIRRMSGSTWGGTGSVMVILDENSAPTDTLSTAKDLSSIVAVNNYFLGGAFHDPRYEGIRFGINGTKGNVLAPNTVADVTADWILRPLSGEQRIESEWVLAMSSDPATLSRNFLGTSEGWLFGLIRDDDGKNVWQKFYPELTDDPGAGIRDLWVDATGNVYVVTDEGKVIYQTVDYNFTEEIGSREVLYDGPSSLVGIWGTGPDNIYFTGYIDEAVMHGVHDAGAGTFTVDRINLVFPNKSAARSTLAPGYDELGRPLR